VQENLRRLIPFEALLRIIEQLLQSGRLTNLHRVLVQQLIRGYIGDPLHHLRTVQLLTLDQGRPKFAVKT
jgi:hypothetical protein